MADILFVRKAPIPTFFLRRFSRVYPALAVFATGLYVASTVLTHFGLPKGMSISLPEYLSGMTFTSNYYQIITNTRSVIGHLWSLSVEEHTYVVLAILAVITARNIGVGAAICACIAVACMINGVLQTIVGHIDGQSVYWRTDVHMGSILISAAMALSLTGRKIPTFAAPVAGIASLILFVLTPDVIRYTIGTAMLAFSVNSLTSAGPFTHRILSAPWLRFIGTISFSLYLWQQPFYKLSERLPAIATPFLLIAAFVCAFISFKIIEGPARDRINRWWGKPERVANPALSEA
ncbi:MAG: Acyltransferase 3 [Sphingomonas bacterium]|nr:Acyltransferase 3 [Sphingomonas bacterium]